MEKKAIPPLEQSLAAIAAGLAETRQLLDENARADKARAAEADKRAAEADKRAAEADKRAAEADKRAAEAAAEADKRATEAAAEADKRAAEAAAEADKRAVEADKRAAKIDADFAKMQEAQKNCQKLIGYEGNAAGAELENDVANLLMKSRDFCGIPLDDVRPNMESLKHQCQFDIVAINGKKVIAIEVKRKLSVKHVRDFADRRLPRFAAAFPAETKGKKVIGAMIYRRADNNDAVAEALNEGFVVLRAVGKKQLHQIKSAEDTTPKKKPGKKRAVKK